MSITRSEIERNLEQVDNNWERQVVRGNLDEYSHGAHVVPTMEFVGKSILYAIRLSDRGCGRCLRNIVLEPNLRNLLRSLVELKLDAEHLSGELLKDFEMSELMRLEAYGLIDGSIDFQAGGGYRSIEILVPGYIHSIGQKLSQVAVDLAEHSLIVEHDMNEFVNVDIHHVADGLNIPPTLLSVIARILDLNGYAQHMLFLGGGEQLYILREILNVLQSGQLHYLFMPAGSNQ